MCDLKLFSSNVVVYIIYFEFKMFVSKKKSKNLIKKQPVDYYFFYINIVINAICIVNYVNYKRDRKILEYKQVKKKGVFSLS